MKISYEGFRSIMPIGDYSVIVKIEGGLIQARKADGRLITSRNAGTDDAEVLQSAINEGVGTVSICGNLILTTPVTVWGGVTIDVESGYFLRNNLTDIYAPCLIFRQFSGIEKLTLDCNGRSGILVGEENVVNSIRAKYIRIWNVGNIFDTVKGPQVAVKMRGWSIQSNYISTLGGNTGVDFYKMSDCFVDSMLIVKSVTGLRLAACEHIFISQIDLDTPTFVGVQIDTSHDINFLTTIWVNNTQYPHVALTFGALIGEFSAASRNAALDLKLKFLRHGGTALKLSNTQDSVFNIEISNTKLYTASPIIARGIEFGTGLSGDVIIKSERLIDAAIKTLGTPYGKLDIPELGFNKGISIFSGNGIARDFLIGSHGLVERPTNPARISAYATPASPAALSAADSTVYASDEDGDGAFESLRVRFASAPATGTNNVTIRWKAEV